MKDIFSYRQFLQGFRNTRYERVGVILQDAHGRNMGYAMVEAGSGCQDRVNISVNKVKAAIEYFGAAMLTLVHGHPNSDHCHPSELDFVATQKLDEILRESHAVKVRDHLIVPRSGDTYSFVQNGHWSFDR